MQKSNFYKFGTFIYPLRWVIIVLWFAIIAACIPFTPYLTNPFKTTGFVDEHAESTKAQAYIDKKLGFDNNDKFIILYSSKSLLATNSAFHNKIKQSLAGLKKLPVKHEIILPSSNKNQISKDKHAAYVVVIFKSEKRLSDKQLTQFKSLLKTPSNMTMQIGGERIFVHEVNKQTQQDLFDADIIAAPLTIITMLLVFGTGVAAIIPIILGAGCALIILTALYWLGHFFTLSIFTINIALLLGLCLSLDYSLFIISRFRDELEEKSVPEAVATTQATAGKAIFFSGLAVLTSLSALLLFPVNILFSVAIGGLTAVIVAVLTATVLLPAVLAVLNKKINWLPILFFRRHKESESSGFWRRLAETVVRRPVFFFVFIFTVLIALGYPFLHAKFGISDHRIFPEGSQNRSFFDAYNEKFDEKQLSPISILVKPEKKAILSRQNLYKLYDLAKTLKDNPLVEQVNSIVTTDPKTTKRQYYTLYHLSHHLMKPGIDALLATTTGRYFSIITVTSKYESDSPQTKQLISYLRSLKNTKGLNVELTGKPVANAEVLDSISRILPYALLWIMGFTYILLLVLLRSLFLPIKAIFMNLLSLCACYGALVLIFQEGYFHDILNFEPQGMLDISLLVIIFCALFGFSMDYEVFLLTRIKEYYDKTQDNEKSIIFGIEKSSRIITSAAIIVIFICSSFLVADILMVKAFGLGIAVAIFVDAFLIRTFLVPATMTLVTKVNWYLPKWLDKLLPKL